MRYHYRGVNAIIEARAPLSIGLAPISSHNFDTPHRPLPLHALVEFRRTSQNRPGSLMDLARPMGALTQGADLASGEPEIGNPRKMPL